MRILFSFILFCFFFQPLLAQTDSQIFLMTIEFSEEGFQISEVKNISDNPGYNSQPYFSDNQTLLYARNNNGQPDIARYVLSSGKTELWNNPTEGGEYSPQTIPNENAFAAVRLDPDGKQRLYRYNPDGTSNELIKDVEVAYFCFDSPNTILASTLGLNQLNLVHLDISSGKSRELLKNSGRCIQHIPNTENLSYTLVNEEKNLDIYQWDPKTQESFFICQLPIGIQDYTWWDDYKIMIGSASALFVYDLYGDGEWSHIGDLSSYGIKNITRLAISPDGTKLAVVGEKIN